MGQRRDLVETLQSARIVGIDTPVFIYYIEQAPTWAAVAEATLRAMTEGLYTGTTSILTLLEIATKPLRLGRPEVADAYEAHIVSIPNFSVVNLNPPVARLGAELRAAYGLRTPDALQIAACLDQGARAFVTNDRRLRRVNEIDVIVLSDFV